jgi:hypothetical protein
MNLDMLNIDTDVEESTDFMPGDFNFDTGVYPCLVDMAYLGESAKGAVSVTVLLKEKEGNRTHKETFYVTSGKEKGRKNYYVKNGKKFLLPGMDNVNQMCLIAAGTGLGKLESEDKMIKLYNFEAKKALPTSVPALVGLIGQEVNVALVKNRTNKQVKVGDDYVKTDKERIFNTASKFFFADGLTVAEAAAGETEATYRDTWTSKFPANYVNDTFEAVAPDATVESASAEAATANAETVKGLFDD